MSCSFSPVDSVCGPTPYAPNELHVIPLKSCRKDLTDYLTNLGVSEGEASGHGLARLMLFSIAPDCIPYQRKTGKGLPYVQSTNTN